MKKSLKIFIISAILIAVFAFGANAYIAGDTDNDFLITAADARFTLRLSVGLEECEANSDQFYAADTDNDGKITAGDARAILRVSVGLEKFEESTASHLDIVMTKLPYKTNGIVINTITEDDYYYYLNITNQTNKSGMAVSSTSYIPYKMYNAKGDVIASNSVYMHDMNNNESCTVKIVKKSNMAKLVFGAASINFKEASLKTDTQTVNGITISKDFTYNGFEITKITLNTEENRLYVTAKNVSGETQNGYITFKATDENGNSLSERSISFCKLNPGEITSGYTSLPSGTVKFIASDVKANKGLTPFNAISESITTTDGISHTSFPVTSNGITFNLVNIQKSEYGYSTTVTLKITNKTGKTMRSYFYYKEFASDGTVKSLYSESTEILNNGESCYCELSIDASSSKFVIGDVSTSDEKSPTPGKLTNVNGLNTNIASESFGGLKLSELTVNKKTSYTEINFRITNSSSKAIDPDSTLFFKALSADKTVLLTRTLSIGKTLNSGEFMYGSITVLSEETVSDFYVLTDKITNCDAVKDSSAYQTLGSLKVTKAPVTFNDLTITSYSIDDDKLIITIKNNTGTAVTYFSYFDYRIHGTDGSVVAESSVFCEQMNKDETCEVFIYLYDNYEKITFTGAEADT